MSPGQVNGVNGTYAVKSANGTNGSSSAGFPLEELSWKITKNASIVSQYLAANHLPQPSKESDGPATVIPQGSPQHIQNAQADLIATSLELLQLALGPSEYLPNLATGYKIFHLVPLTGSITYTDLASAAGVSDQRLKSIVRMAMTNSLFREQADGKSLAHSATSALLARNEDAYAYATYMCSRSAPMAMGMAAAHQKYGTNSMKTYETAYNVAFNTDLTFFDHLSRDPEKMGEFARYMRNVRSSEGVDIKHLVAGFAWSDLPEGAKVIDVGGSTGTSAIALANANPHLNFVVEDLPENADAGRKAAQSLPTDISSRIEFLGHDFSKPQPIVGADVYLLRMILHDWPDNDSIKILSNLVDAMEKPGSRLIIMDTVLPDPGSVPVSVERIVRARDLTMMQAFNSKERDLDDWNSLLAATDSRLKIVNVVQPFGSAMSIIEVALQ